MKRAFIVIAVITICSVAVYLRAQNEPGTAYTVRLVGGDVAVKANGRQLRGNGATFTNGVVLAVNGVRVTADEAAIHVSDAGGDGKAKEIELTGTVRLSLAAAP